MTRHNEQFRVRLLDIRHSFEREYIGGRDFRLNTSGIADRFLLPLSARMIDMLRVASSVYFADRLLKRDRKAGAGWSREIACSVQVRDTDFWKSGAARDALEEAVSFVSGDEWHFDFVADSAPIKRERQINLPGMQPFDDPPIICLYSGGFDSAAGLARRLREGVDRPVVPVVIRHRPDIARKTDEQFRLLKQEFDAQIDPVCIPMSMVSPMKLIGSEEDSQRARSFLFVAVGGVVAWATGSSTVELYESGVGAINVPLLASMEGSQATRSSHPKFLMLMSRLLSMASDRPISAVLPFLGLTKGELAKSVTVGKLTEMARLTISCAHYPIRNDKGGTWKSCGICPACIFRRVALHSAGIDETQGTYERDILDPDSCPVEWKKLKYLAAFLNQIDSLAEVATGNLPLIVSQHLIRTDILRSGESQQTYVDLYGRYRREWLQFVTRAQMNGCNWAYLIDVPEQAA